MTLEHVHPHCTGTWRRGQTFVRCSGCGAVYHGCPDVDRAAYEENRAGELLVALSTPPRADGGPYLFGG